MAEFQEIVYGSFPFTGGYAFHPSNFTTDNKLNFPVGCNDLSAEIVEESLRLACSENSFVISYVNHWHLVGRSFVGTDGVGRNTTVIQAFWINPETVRSLGSIPDPKNFEKYYKKESPWSFKENITKVVLNKSLEPLSSMVTRIDFSKKKVESSKAKGDEGGKQKLKRILLYTLIGGPLICMGILYLLKPYKNPIPQPERPKPIEQPSYSTNQGFKDYEKYSRKVKKMFPNMPRKYIVADEIKLNAEYSTASDYLLEVFGFLLNDKKIPEDSITSDITLKHLTFALNAESVSKEKFDNRLQHLLKVMKAKHEVLKILDCKKSKETIDYKLLIKLEKSMAHVSGLIDNERDLKKNTISPYKWLRKCGGEVSRRINALNLIEEYYANIERWR